MKSPYDLSSHKPRVSALKPQENKDTVALQKEIANIKKELKHIYYLLSKLTRAQRRQNAD